MIAKAWGVFVGSTGVLQKQFNSSVARTAAGVYTVTFGTPMTSSHYVVLMSSSQAGVSWRMPVYYYDNQTTVGFNIYVGDADNPNSYYDPSGTFSFAVFDV